MSQDPQLLNLPWNVKVSDFILGCFIDITRRSNGTVNRFLASFFDVQSSPSKKPINGVTSTDITVDEDRNLWFRLYTPSPTEGNDTLPVIFYYHGGGFVYLSSSSKPLDEFCRTLARKLPAVIISVNYRLAPEHRYPAPIEDCFDTLKFIDENEVEGFPSYANLKNCFLLGDSAGGNLVHHVQIKASKHEFLSLKLIGNMLIQPFFGGEERTESEARLDGKVPFITIERADWMWKVYLPEGSDRDHHAANVFGINNSDDVSELEFPATVVFTAEFDPLRDWQKRYFDGLMKFGKDAYYKEYSNTFHSFYIYPWLPEFSLLIDDMKDFTQNQLKAANI